MGIRIGIGSLKIGQGSTGVDWSSYWATLISAVVNDTDATKIDLTFASAASLDETDFTLPDITLTGASWAGAVLTLTASAAIYTSPTITFVPTGGTSLVKNPRFIITVDTTKAGSANDTFILPTAGGASVYDYYVDWGDGSEEAHIEVNTSQTHDYNETGEFQIKIRGTFPRIYFNNAGDKAKIISIDNWGSMQWSSMENAFYGCANVEANYNDYPDTSIVKSFDSMFHGAALFNGAVNFDTSEGIYCRNMLRSCALFNQDISGWDFGKMQYCAALFYGCLVFNQPVNHLVTSVTVDCHAMFVNCRLFNQPVNLWDTSNVFNIDQLFSGCYLFNQSVSNFDTSNVGVGELGYMFSMFQDCHVFNQSVSNFVTTNVTRMDNMFNNCYLFNQSVSNFDTANVTNMNQMFLNCPAFNQSVSSFNTAKVTDMASMFQGCHLFNQEVDFDLTACTTINRMFDNCHALNSDITLSNYTGINAIYLFNGCYVLNSTISVDLSNVKSMLCLMQECKEYNQPLTWLDTSSCTNMQTMFAYCYAFNQDVSGLDTADVTTMNSMFLACTVFNQSLASFNIANVTVMTNMLQAANALSTANYDATLIAWAAQTVKPNISVHFGDAKYSAGDAATARAVLDDAPNNWTITDGGQVV